MISGSRASNYYDWHVRHYLIDKAGKWRRSTGDEKETDENDIGLGHVELGTIPK